MTAQKSKETFSAIKMKRRIQAKIYEETRGMNQAETLAYFRARIAHSEFAGFLDLLAAAEERIAQTGGLTHDEFWRAVEEEEARDATKEA